MKMPFPKGYPSACVSLPRRISTLELRTVIGCNSSKRKTAGLAYVSELSQNVNGVLGADAFAVLVEIEQGAAGAFTLPVLTDKGGLAEGEISVLLGLLKDKKVFAAASVGIGRAFIGKLGRSQPSANGKHTADVGKGIYRGATVERMKSVTIGQIVAPFAALGTAKLGDVHLTAPLLGRVKLYEHLSAGGVEARLLLDLVKYAPECPPGLGVVVVDLGAIK